MERDSESLFNKRKIDSLLEIVAKAIKKKKVKIILAGGLAMIAYGMPKRHTYDIDAEILSDASSKLIENLSGKLERLGIAADLSDNICRWGMIDLPPGYRERTRLFKKIAMVEFHLLSPVDLIISKLRVFRDIDIDDAHFLIKRFNISINKVKRYAGLAIKASPNSTELLIFKKNLKYFERNA